MPMDLPPIKLAPNVRHQLYLAFKEALHNVIKHAAATEVQVRLEIDGEIAKCDLGSSSAGADRSCSSVSLVNLQIPVVRGSPRRNDSSH